MSQGRDSEQRSRLIIALDVATAREAREIFAATRDSADMFKIGSQLFTAAGPDLVREIVGAGGRVFLDLKFHDIPNTVAAAGVEAARLGVSIFNVHASGGREMMQRVAGSVSEAAEREGFARPAIIGVTVLTSQSAGTLEEVRGMDVQIAEEVARLARLAAKCGLDGVVASPLEVQAVRQAVGREPFLVVTPGVRPAGAAPEDQKRFTTPANAIRAGADWVVVGRAITNASSPSRAAEEICREIQRAAAPVEGEEFRELS